MLEKRKGYIIPNKLERYSYSFYVLLRFVRLGVQQSAIIFKGLRVEFWKRSMDELDCYRDPYCHRFVHPRTSLCIIHHHHPLNWFQPDWEQARDYQV